ncbi:hypothetical protein EW145_g2097 [Phellinidium pouzarii]|uniref:Protein kinase domain-containing protein n=1 Tax=Phellinidium pouzarii TaxID=167371 RepID=A0A4V3XDD8_9AGAM|nr:hypothetical protein EW145_g2097 [Phellinidium pouzarii]
MDKTTSRSTICARRSLSAVPESLCPIGRTQYDYSNPIIRLQQPSNAANFPLPFFYIPRPAHPLDSSLNPSALTPDARRPTPVLSVSAQAAQVLSLSLRHAIPDLSPARLLTSRPRGSTQILARLYAPFHYPTPSAPVTLHISTFFESLAISAKRPRTHRVVSKQLPSIPFLMPIRVIGQNSSDTLESPKTKKGLRTVLGFYSSNSSPASPNPSPTSTSFRLRSAQTQTQTDKEKISTLRERRSVDVTSSGSGSYFVSLSYRKKTARSREERASVTDISFFQSNPSSVPSTPKPAPAPLLLPSPQSYTVILNSPESKKRMTKAPEIPHERASRRKMARIEAQDGPWSVSVAESPYDRNSYSIYIKTQKWLAIPNLRDASVHFPHFASRSLGLTDLGLYILAPTHHMTLTRTVQEILDFHRKITSAHTDLSLPDVPLNQDENVENPTDKKRKPSFLHTLSRLASPGPNRRERPKDTKVPNTTPSSRSSVASSAYPTTSSMSHTTLASTPGRESENWDPFLSPLASPMDGGSATSTALAGYLTTLSNEPGLKRSKSWRQFVRIRADDLISERVERAVKRVRSDLAAHLSGSRRHSRKMDIPDDASLAESGVMVGLENEVVDLTPHSGEELSGNVIGKIKEEEEEEDTRKAESLEVENRDEGDLFAQDLPGTPKPRSTLTRGSIEIPDVSDVASAKSLSTPTETNAAMASRIPRSQSADPDKATRMSRIFEASPLENGGDESAAEYESEAPVETEVEEARSTTTMEDDSSMSTSGVTHKSKRSKSAMNGKDKLAKKAKSAKKVVINDFEMTRVLGKGCAGKVLLVRHKKTDSLYALKAITKRHVLAHQELQHTLTEQAVLKRMAREAKDPFVVKLYWSFHDKENLFLVMDFHPGGDLATQLARWGRLGRDRARFYAAEIVEGVDGLHAAGVIYRDLKPENILIGADGHIVLTDFGLSKEFPRRTSPITAPATPSGSRSDFSLSTPPVPHWMKGEDKTNWPIGQNDSTSTFCGTAEYLAPEVIQGQPYSYEVDWWSFGTMLYEMLTGITPFWANNHSEMYVRVLQDELKFPDDRVMDQDTKSLIRGLLQRNPALRIKQPRIKKHPYFSMIDWSHVYYKRYIPPYIPPIDPLNASDTQNFDETFLDMEPVIADEHEQGESGEEHADEGEKTDGEEVAARAPTQSRSPSEHAQADEGSDLFDGYSFKGRHSVLIEDEDDEAEVEEEEGEGDDEIDDEEDIQRLANADVGQTVEDEQPPSIEAEEPKTPEARKAELPAELPEFTPAEEIAALHKAATAAMENMELSTPAKDSATHHPREKTPEVVAVSTAEDREETPPASQMLHGDAVPQPAIKPAPSAAVSRLIAPLRGSRTRREKSGIHALDKYLSDGGDEDDDVATERDEDDDWDFIEAPVPGAEDRNGSKGTSLFARGVVDRYRLAVFRKSLTPAKNTQQRNVSGMSLASDLTVAEASSPSPQRRGRNPGLTFRRNPKQFLRARSPPPSNTSSNGISKASAQPSNFNTISSVTSGSTGLLTPSPSTHPSTVAGPSLRSKESTTSMGSPASSDDQSLNGDAPNSSAFADLSSNDVKPNGVHSIDTSRRVITIDEPEKPKTKKLKKYKENAEKVLSLFASPR